MKYLYANTGEMLSGWAGLAGINQSYYCHTATMRFRGPAGKPDRPAWQHSLYGDKPQKY